MRRLRELYARSRRLPVRFRIALVSAALTAVILIGFAAVVGRLTSNRLHNDFKDDLQSNATRIAGQNGRGLGLTDDSVVRVVYQTGIPVPGFDSSPVELGAPQPGTIVRSGDLDVAAAPIVSASDSILGTGAPRVRRSSGKTRSKAVHEPLDEAVAPPRARDE